MGCAWQESKVAKKDTVEEDSDVFDTKTCYGFARSFGLTKAQLEFCNRSKRQADGYRRWAKRVPELQQLAGLPTVFLCHQRGIWCSLS